MTLRSRFDAISPLDHRFYGGDTELYAALHPYLSADAAVRYQAKVEAALARALAEAGVCDREAAASIALASERVTPEEVAAEEARIGHDVRALVNVIRGRVEGDAKRFVHLGATSYDIVDTANALRYRAFVERVLLRRLGALVGRCMTIAEVEAEAAQVGRTHGQHAVPITFGFAVAAYVSRLGGRMLVLAAAAKALPGKLSGAVGAYNAQSLLVADPRDLERRFLADLGLPRATHSTQIVEPEGWNDLAHACVSAMGVMANLADDLRHLQRSEIAEIAEAFAEAQVGSSTMPQKRNPVSFENVKSLWKAMMPRVITTYLDQISEHQRDLTNSASGRFLPELLAGCAYAASRLESSLAGMRIERERMKANLASSRDALVAEPLYVVLAKHGHRDAHEVVRRLTLEAERTGRPVLEIAAQEASLRETLAKLTPQERRAIEKVEEYRGAAPEVAREVCKVWRGRLREWMPE